MQLPVPLQPRFDPLLEQRMYVDSLLDEVGPLSPAELAEACGVSLEVVRTWHQDPQFSNWMAFELQRQAEPLVALVWREVYRGIMKPGNSAKSKAEMAKLFLSRFDPVFRMGKVDLQRMADCFGKELARQVTPTSDHPDPPKELSVEPHP